MCGESRILELLYGRCASLPLKDYGRKKRLELEDFCDNANEDQKDKEIAGSIQLAPPHDLQFAVSLSVIYFPYDLSGVISQFAVSLSIIYTFHMIFLE